MKTQNYIHTLLVCHFNVSLAIAKSVRYFFHENISKRELYINWVESKIWKLHLPTFKRKNDWHLFENTADRRKYCKWREGGKISEGWSVTHLDICKNSPYGEFEISLQYGCDQYVLLMKQSHMSPEAKYYALCIPYAESPKFSQDNELNEIDFYSKIESLFDMIKTTHEIPLELFGAK